MKRNFIIGLIAILAVAGIVYAQTVNRQIYGVATPGLYKYTLSTNTQDAYLLSVPTLSVADTIVGLAATQTLTNKTLTSPTISNLTASKPVFTDGSSVLTSSGTMPVNQGGTGLTSYAVGDIPYASATTTISKLAAVAAGRVLISAGTTTAPAWSTSPTVIALTANTMTNSNLTASKPIFTNASSVLVSTGTMPVAQGGTNLTSYTVGDLPYADGTTSLAKLAAVASGMVLQSAGTTTAPAYVDKNQFTAAAQHDYAAGVTDWTLNATEIKAIYLSAKNASGGVIIYPPDSNGYIYFVYNSTGQNLTIKKSGGTGITIATNKIAGVVHNGTDYVRLTTDSSP